MARIKIKKGIRYECPECENEDVLLGDNFCKDCGEEFEWYEDYSDYEVEDDE